MSLDQYTQNIALSSGEFETEKTYWLEKLQGEIVMSAFPAGSNNPGTAQYLRSAEKYEWNGQIFEKLLGMGKNSPYGIFMILLVALKYLLYRYTGSEDVIIGMPVFISEAGTDSGARGTINNIVLLRSAVDENSSFKDLLLAVRRNVTEADEYSDFPYQIISRLLSLENPDDALPYIKTVVLLEQIHDPKMLANVRADMVFSFSLQEASLELNLEYNANLYEKEMLDEVARHFTNVLGAITQNPNIILSEIDFLTAEDKQRILVDFNNTMAEYPKDKTIHRLFTEQAERTPENTALICQGKRLSYRELDERSNHLAGKLKDYLQRSGVTSPGRVMGIMAERSLEMIIGMFAVLKAGGAYLPIDPEYPLERIHYMLEDSGGTLLLTQKHLMDNLSGYEKDLKVIDLEDEEFTSEGSARSKENSNFDGRGGDLAYIIYTSGTTGKSKGAMIEHRNVVRLLFNDKMQFDFNEKDVWTMFHSFCFDFSVWEIYGALLYGGTLVIVPKSTAQDPAEYLKLLNEHQVTVLNQTPAAFYRLNGEELKSPERSLALRYVIFGGEALKPVMLKEWRKKYPKVKLINMYGITETTVHVTYKEITEKEIEVGISNIGKPIPTLTTYIMDKKLRLLPIGAIGELCVGGDGVGRGYLNRPELTAEKFTPNPFYKEQFRVKSEEFRVKDQESSDKLPLSTLNSQLSTDEDLQLSTLNFKLLTDGDCQLSTDRLYRSGDLARMLPNGDMEYFGRIDHQVKIRGHRIELGEIEAVLLKYSFIREVVAIVGEDGDKNQYICAYYVAEKDLTINELREYLAGKLPGYMIPAYFIRLEKIPTTANNKVDRKALPKTGGDTYTGELYEAPGDESEAKLVKIWEETLNIGQLGVNDNFFNLGGDSIKAISLINKMNRVLGSNIAIKDIYMYQTVRELAAYIGESGTREHSDDLSIGLTAIESFKKTVLEEMKTEGADAHKLPGDYEDFYPLSPIQQGMVFFSKLRPEEPIYHDQFPYLLKIKGFDINVFNEALRLMIRRHPILRTTFVAEDFSEPLQVVHNADSGIVPPVQMDDLAGLDSQAQEKAVYAYLESDLKNKFEFCNDLLWRMRVFKLKNDDYCIILSFQHAVLDGWSVAILMSELFKNLEILVKGERYEVKELKTSYKDYVALNLSRKSAEKVHQYWKDTFQSYTRNKLPFNISNKKINNLTGIRILRRELDFELLKALEEKAKEFKSTVKNICLAAHVYLLGIVTTENDIITGVVTHDRPVMEDSDMVLGCYLNTIPIRVNTKNEIKKTDILDTVKNALRNAKANELFLADIASIIGERSSLGNPVFDTLYNYTDFHILESVAESDIIGKPESRLQFGSNEMTNTLLDLEIANTFNVLILQIKYAPYYFLDEDIAALADLYTRILGEFAFGNDEYLRNEELLTSEQFKAIVYEFNNTKVPYAKEKTMHRLFEEQAARTPDNIALVLDEQQMTYRELNEKANQLARMLIKKGVKQGDHIALVAQRGLEMIIGMFAILKSGGAYVPVDPEYPPARRKYIADNSKVTAILADREYEIEHENIIMIDDSVMSSYPDTNLNINQDTLPAWAHDLAYVIYTSGSTGVPKGVMIEHHSAVNLISWVNKEFNINENDALLFITSMCFDLSVYDIFGTLATGGRVVIARKEQVQNPDELKQILEKNKITFWDSVPSTMNYLINYLDESNDAYIQNNLRLVFMSGDWIPVKLPGRLKKYFPKAQVISLGGATEGTIWSNYYPVERVDEYQTSIPYGKPIANNYFYILDRNLKVVPKGVAGELFIGGVGVAKGYMNDEERTRASFIRNRFLDGPDEMMYKTGDLGRMLPDGNMEFLGRIDHQVKIRGYRVELGEIENQLLKHPAVKDAVTVDKTDTGGNKYLCAYIVWHEGEHKGAHLTVAEMKDYLSHELPDYMIPAYFVSIDLIPLTSNGKIDRRALPEPGGSINTGVVYVAPRDQIETELSKLWQEVLETEKIGINDNFFEIGGHSLKATMLVSRIHKYFNIEITLREAFSNQTVAEMAELIKTRRAQLEELEQMFQDIENMSDEEVRQLLSNELRAE